MRAQNLCSYVKIEASHRICWERSDAIIHSASASKFKSRFTKTSSNFRSNSDQNTLDIQGRENQSIQPYMLWFKCRNRIYANICTAWQKTLNWFHFRLEKLDSLKTDNSFPGDLVDHSPLISTNMLEMRPRSIGSLFFVLFLSSVSATMMIVCKNSW